MSKREKNFVKAYFASTKIDGVKVVNDTVVIPFSGKKPSDEFKKMVREGLIANDQYPDIKSSANFTWSINRPATMNSPKQVDDSATPNDNSAKRRPSGMQQADGAAASNDEHQQPSSPSP